MNWVVANPFQLPRFGGYVPPMFGKRVVVLKNGVPARVLPKTNVSAKARSFRLSSSDKFIAISDYAHFEFSLTDDLFTADDISISCAASVSVRSKEDDTDALRIAADFTDLISEMERIVSNTISRLYRGTTLDSILDSMDSMEEKAFDALLSWSSGRHLPYSFDRIDLRRPTINDITALAHYDEERKHREAEAAHHRAMDEKKWLLEVALAEQRQIIELNDIKTKADIDNDAARSRMQIAKTRDMARVNREFGIAAMPLDVQIRTRQMIFDCLTRASPVESSSQATDDIANSIMEILKLQLAEMVSHVRSGQDSESPDLDNMPQTLKLPAEHPDEDTASQTRTESDNLEDNLS
jgi:hypothetical protein